MQIKFSTQINCLILCLAVLSSASAQFLPGQIMIDPANDSYLVYNRDRDKNGSPDPFYAIGPGEPENFLYMGERRPDGTRDGKRQTELITRMKQHGGNTLYFQLVRSHGGDGEADDNPWNDPANSASGINALIIAQWKG